MVLGLRCSVGRRQKSDRDQYSQWGVNGTKLAIFSMLPWYTVQGRRKAFEKNLGGRVELTNNLWKSFCSDDNSVKIRWGQLTACPHMFRHPYRSSYPRWKMKNLPWVDNCHDLPHAGEIRLSFLTISHNDPFGLFFNKNIQCLKTDMTTPTIAFFGSMTFIEIYIIHFDFSLRFLWKNCHNFNTILSFEHLNKVIDTTKYSKHWPYTVAHTIECVCRKC